MKKKIILLWQKAEKSMDPIQKEEIYGKLISRPETSRCLSPQEMSNIHFNRAINFTELADISFDKHHYETAHLYAFKALESAHIAQQGYLTETDILASAALIKDCKKNLFTVEKKLTAQRPRFLFFGSGSPLDLLAIAAEASASASSPS